jgi:hypothetical protein
MDTLKNYLPVCWFKGNTLELKRSIEFFKHNVVFYFFVEFFLQANMTDDPVESFYEVSFETLLTVLFIWVMLALNRTLYTFVQICTAVLFCSNAASCVLIPVLVWLTISENTISYYLVGLIVIWDYAMTTYVFKQVLMLNLAASAVVSLFYAGFTYFGAYTLGQLVQ